ncbi:MAG: RNA 2',3'-cyclic phosphodiesterase [Lentisphaerae bacterium]|nr:RNA 2',3'-cyclic phosphodiesterase [Lentisphaerota bacterium]
MKCEGLIRAFVGVPLDDAVRRDVARLQERLKGAGARVGWVRGENLHVTMAFLGDVTVEQVEAAAGALAAAARASPPFRCEVKGVGVFGRPRAPRVVWAGIGAGAENLCGLQGALAAELAQRGLPVEDRPFVPHVTMGRVRSGAGAGPLLRQIEAAAEREFGFFDAGAVVLYRSRLEPAGAVYAALREVPLGVTPG